MEPIYLKRDYLFSYPFNRPFGRNTYFKKQGNVNFTNNEERQNVSYVERELLFTAGTKATERIIDNKMLFIGTNIKQEKDSIKKKNRAEGPKSSFDSIKQNRKGVEIKEN